MRGKFCQLLLTLHVASAKKIWFMIALAPTVLATGTELGVKQDEVENDSVVSKKEKDPFMKTSSSRCAEELAYGSNKITPQDSNYFSTAQKKCRPQVLA